MMKVLILWADDNSANLGVRVLAEGTRHLVARAVGEAEFECQDFLQPDDVAMLRTTEIAKGFVGSSTEIRAYMDEFDLIVDTGAGDSFTDIYGLDRLVRRTHAHRQMGSTRAQLIFGPQTIGPFGSVVGRRLARRSLARADTVLTRDSTSSRFVSGVLGRESTLATDVVFALDAPSVSHYCDVIVNASGLLWNENSHVDHMTYRREVGSLVRGLLDQGRHVTLLAHVLDNPSDDNDMRAVADLDRQFAGNVDVMIPRSLDDARRVIAGARALVGARMHACLNALSVGVPAVPWAYSRKFAPLMNDLGWSESIDMTASTSYAEPSLAVLSRWGAEFPRAELDELNRGVAPKLQTAVDAIKMSRRRGAGH